MLPRPTDVRKVFARSDYAKAMRRQQKGIFSLMKKQEFPERTQATCPERSKKTVGEDRMWDDIWDQLPPEYRSRIRDQSMNSYQGFKHHELDDGCEFWSGSLPSDLTFKRERFQALWDLHPHDFHLINMGGREVKTPRWQQAFAKDYQYSGRVNKALPMPEILLPFRSWCQDHIDASLNGLLLNWYDGKLGHYIGKHRDSVIDLIHPSPIVTISFGEERVFRLRRPHVPGYRDFPAQDGSVFIMPFETNERWTHEVPRSKKRTGRRISVTLRSFL